MSEHEHHRYLKLDQWAFEDWFLPVPPTDPHPVLAEVDRVVRAADIGDHPFFRLARHSRRALEIWVAQELVISNAFSQIVLSAASRIVNVHLRALLAEIAFGEHGKVTRGIARRAHPWLIKELAESMGIDATQVRPEPATLQFLAALADSASDAISAIAWIGIGNETLILPEYAVVRECFVACAPETAYAGFLDANLAEDINHSRICLQIATALLSGGADPIRFMTEAAASVESRISYLHALLHHAAAEGAE